MQESRPDLHRECRFVIPRIISNVFKEKYDLGRHNFHSIRNELGSGKYPQGISRYPVGL